MPKMKITGNELFAITHSSMFSAFPMALHQKRKVSLCLEKLSLPVFAFCLCLDLQRKKGFLNIHSVILCNITTEIYIWQLLFQNDVNDFGAIAKRQLSTLYKQKTWIARTLKQCIGKAYIRYLYQLFTTETQWNSFLYILMFLT